MNTPPRHLHTRRSVHRDASEEATCPTRAHSTRVRTRHASSPATYVDIKTSQTSFEQIIQSKKVWIFIRFLTSVLIQVGCNGGGWIDAHSSVEERRRRVPFPAGPVGAGEVALDAPPARRARRSGRRRALRRRRWAWRRRRPDLPQHSGGWLELELWCRHLNLPNISVFYLFIFHMICLVVGCMIRRWAIYCCYCMDGWWFDNWEL